MIEGGTGGANTRTGLEFEGKFDLRTKLESIPGYTVDGINVYYQGEEIGQILKKYELYSQFLKPRGVNWKEYISSQLLPDNGIYVIVSNTAYILETKTQKKNGSVDEKLQSCDFKKKQYMKLFSPLNIDVQYIYILSDWFRRPKYRDVLDYIVSMGCQYFIEYIPLKEIGLPLPSTM